MKPRDLFYHLTHEMRRRDIRTMPILVFGNERDAAMLLADIRGEMQPGELTYEDLSPHEVIGTDQLQVAYQGIKIRWPAGRWSASISRPRTP